MSMRDTYQAAIAACKGHMEGNAEERDGKLYFKGTVGTEEEKNRIWDAIKTVPSWQNDIVADIKVQPKAAAASGGGSAAAKTYTVAAGDTLSKIAQQTLGDAKQYMKIFEANRDQLSDPDKIRPGQVLKIPA